MNIKMISVPDTELMLSPIGYGTSDIGLPETDMGEITNLLEAYLEMGGNVIDTARVYSDWVPPAIERSETILGKWIRARGHHRDFTLITKGGHPRLDTMHTPRMSGADMQEDIELSLRALGVDCIDIYLFHRDDPAVPVGEHLEIMETFRRQGKLRYYGCSNWSTERMEEANRWAAQHGCRGFVANQMLYNVGCRFMKPHSDDTMAAMDENMLAFHQDGRCLAMPYFGICSGFFHRLDRLGVRAVQDSPYYTEGNLQVKNGLDRIMRETGCTLTQAVLGFFFAQEIPLLPLVSTSSAAHLKDIMETLRLELPMALYHQPPFCPSGEGRL